MNDWKRITLSSAEILEGKADDVHEKFRLVFVAAEGPQNAALFEHETLEGERAFYFSTGAARIFRTTLTEHQAAECAAPPRPANEPNW